jgi:N-hydroxyarylamine O-acetyltransferase
MTSTDTEASSPDRLRAGEAEAYLRRLGVAPATIGAPDLEALGRLQGAHVTTVPFETLPITGDP